MTNTPPTDMAKLADELRKYWSFDNDQMHTHSWHDRENFIERVLPKWMDALRAPSPPAPVQKCNCGYWRAARLSHAADCPAAAPALDARTVEALEQIEKIIADHEQALIVPGLREIKQIWRIAREALAALRADRGK
jgi:hypothetical protein